MAASQLTSVIEHLRRLVLWRDAAGLTDKHLLESFIDRHEETAFEVLVRRHAGMVMGVCRRILRSHHDAEDAFQATFLVLARKAASITSRESLAHWLYCVAYKTSLKAKAAGAQRRVREREGAEMPKSEAMAPEHRSELHDLLDQELNRLSAKYRVAVVLCDLEGKTRKEAARELGCPEGTVATRLARGRAMLAKRLRQRGVALSAAVLAGWESLNIAAAGVPTPLIASTSKAAFLYATGQVVAGVVSSHVAALAARVIQAMVLTKLKSVALAVLAVGATLIGTGSGLLMYQTAAAPLAGKKLAAVAKMDDQADKPPSKNPDARPASAPAADRKVDIDELLKKFASAKYFWEQEEVARQLVATGDPKIISKIEKHLETKNRCRKCNAALVLAGLGDKRGLDIIIRELEDKEVGDRYVDPKGRFNGPVPRPMPNESAENYQKRRLAAMLPVLAASQISQDRYYAGLLLGQLRKKEAVPALIAATKDPAVNLIAALSLGQIGDKGAIPALHKMIETFPEQRLWAGSALAALGEPKGFDILAEVAISDSNWTDRRHAVEAMGTVGHSRSVPILTKALKDQHVNVRVSAARSLAKIGDPAAIPALTEALSDTEETQVNAPTTVDREARLALEAIKAKRK